MLSATTLADPLDRRLRTAGRIVPEMQVRLFDGDRDVTESGRGQPACRGPALSLGYLGGTDHDKLFTKDGWMRMGDICELDADGYLTLAGRTSDFILRGGKNISAVQVEEAVATHPAVAVAAAVAMPDPLFGERVCVFVELQADQPSTCPRSSSTCWRKASPRSYCPSDSRCSTNYRGHPAARSQKANFATPFDRHWSGHDDYPRRSTPGRPRGMGAVEGAAHRRRPHRRTAAGVRLPHLADDRLRREHGRAHHLAAPTADRHVRQPVGTVVAGARPHPTSASSTRTHRWSRGRWDVTPAIHIHTELHRQRPDARVVIHNHPYYVSLIAALGVLPDLVHQTGSLFLDDMYLVEKYDGEIDSPWRACRTRRAGRDPPTCHPGEPRRHRDRTRPSPKRCTARCRSSGSCRLAYDVMLDRPRARRR